MADTTTPTKPRKRTRTAVWVAAALTLIGVALAAEAATGRQSRCDRAEAAVDDVLEAMAVFGQDDPDLLDIYRERNTARIDACT
jgi:hypothetical protein